MRLREAILSAIQQDACLAKLDRQGRLRIKGAMFVAEEYRNKYCGFHEVRMNVSDCLADDWYLVKDGTVFHPKKNPE